MYYMLKCTTGSNRILGAVTYNSPATALMFSSSVLAPRVPVFWNSYLNMDSYLALSLDTVFSYIFTRRPARSYLESWGNTAVRLAPQTLRPLSTPSLISIRIKKVGSQSFRGKMAHETCWSFPKQLKKLPYKLPTTF